MGKKSAWPEFLIIGRILAPWGRRGELKVHSITDFPDRFAPGHRVYIDEKPLEIEGSRSHQQFLLLKLATIDCIEDAEQLRRKDISIPAVELSPLPPGEYYAFQLIGLDVITSDGVLLGQITDIISTASNDVYVVETDKGEALIPAIDDVVTCIDIDKGQMIIEVIEGLLPL